MSTLLLQNVTLEGQPRDILIQDGRFKAIAPRLAVPADRALDCRRLIIVPAFYNAHTHAAMSGMRGYADDTSLFIWLHNHIWPFEHRLTPPDVYAFSRLAILEMIHTGTVFFNDMYWYPAETLRAAEEMGVRAALGRLYIEQSPGVLLETNVASNRALEQAAKAASPRIQITHAPHAIYTVSEKTLRPIAERAAAEKSILHIHASETQIEVDECVKAHRMTPIAWLDACGALGPRTILAHCVHLTPGDIATIRDRGAVIAHNPCSNLKLASGRFPYAAAVRDGHCRLTIGTDGAASNNNLSMLEEMKFAALSAKDQAGDPTVAPADEVFAAATRAGAQAFGIDAGAIRPGLLADCLLIRSRHPLMTPNFHLLSNLVYSADSSCIDTVICDGRILMQRGTVPGEEEILDAAEAACRRLAVPESK